MVKSVTAMKLKTRGYFRSAAMLLSYFHLLYVKSCACSLQDMNLAMCYGLVSE
jgi:hypothetical protein